MYRNPAIADAAPGGAADASIDRRTFLATGVLAAGALLLGAPAPATAAGMPTLQGQLVGLVNRMRATGVIRGDEQTSWSVYDFNSRKKLVSINEEIPRQAASMMKPFVAQAFFFTLDENPSRLSYTADTRALMERMIRKSDNNATNELMQIVSRYNGNTGPRATEAILRRRAPSVFAQVRFVEYIPADGRTYNNLASARDYSRFLYSLWYDRLPHSREVLSLMALPNNDRITRGVANMPSDVRVYDKTGSTARLCGNMGIIECRDPRGRPRPYTFVGIIEKAHRSEPYTTWITQRSNAIREVSNLVYLYMRDTRRVA